MTFDDAITITLGDGKRAMKTRSTIGYFSVSSVTPVGADFGIAFRYRSSRYPFTDYPVFPVTYDSVRKRYVVGTPSAATNPATADPEFMRMFLGDDWYVSTVAKCERAMEKLVTPEAYDGLKIHNVSSGVQTLFVEANGNPDPIGLEYSFNSRSWVAFPMDVGSITVPRNGVVCLRASGSGNATFSKSLSDYYTISTNTVSKATGNVMSLLDKTMSSSSVPDYAFVRLFGSRVLPHENVSSPQQCTLSLPALTIGAYAYSGMFRDSYIKVAPSLPATNGGEGCYHEMFCGCSNLSGSVPGGIKLSSVPKRAFQSMFGGCTSLTSFPVSLYGYSITSASEECCKGMFSGCIGIYSYGSILPNGHAVGCFESMFSGCVKMVTAPAVRTVNMFLSERSCKEMFKGCVRLADSYHFSSIPSGFVVGKEACMGMYQDCTSVTGVSEIVSCHEVRESGFERMYSGSGMSEHFPCPVIVGKRGCYHMLDGCVSLESRSSLDFTTSVGESGFEGMFSGCTGIKYASPLNGHITFAGPNCFKDLYSGCTGLTDASTVNIGMTTVPKGCCEGMFRNCSSLSSFPTLTSTGMSEGCYREMFKGCVSLSGAVPALPATIAAENCYEAMFEGCTGLTSVNGMQLSVPAAGCCRRMFYGCSSLASVTGKFPFSVSGSTENWMYGVSGTGTFNCTWRIGFPDTIPASSRGPSGVPIGWSVNTDSTGYDGLRFVSKQDGSTVNMHVSTDHEGVEQKIYYSTDGSTWTRYPNDDRTDIVLDNGDVMYVRASAGGNTTITYGTGGNVFSISGNVEAYGNLMSVFDATLNRTSVHGYNNLYQMFYGCTGLTRVPDTIFFPFSSERGSWTYRASYGRMFEGCTGLTTVPAFPESVDTYASSSHLFYRMYHGCSGIRSVPDIVMSECPTLYNMFESTFAYCTGLERLPAVRLKKMGYRCCYRMFDHCTGAGFAGPVGYPETIMSSECCAYMYYGCTSLLGSSTDNFEQDRFILYPENLADGCYSFMFAGSSLFPCIYKQSLRRSADQLPISYQKVVPSSSVSNYWADGTSNFYAEPSSVLYPPQGMIFPNLTTAQLNEARGSGDNPSVARSRWLLVGSDYT